MAKDEKAIMKGRILLKIAEIESIILSLTRLKSGIQDIYNILDDVPDQTNPNNPHWIDPDYRRG